MINDTEQFEEDIYYKKAEGANEESSDGKLVELLNELSSSRIKDIESTVKRFNSIYRNGYRHKYSGILEILISMGYDSRDFLYLNLEELYAHINKNSNHSNIRKPFNKLYDHVCLEITRLAQYDMYRQTEDSLIVKINSVKNELDIHRDEMFTKIHSANHELKEANSKIENGNAQTVSVLGIFTAVVMVFFGGLNVLGNILSSMNQASSVRVVFMASLTGIIVFNIIFLLCYILAKILNKNIATNDLELLYEKCYEWDSVKKEVKTNQKALNKYRKTIKSPIRRLGKRYPVVFYFNTFMISTMACCVIIWSIRKGHLNTLLGLFSS
jgi:flagellar motor component MotA